MTDLSGIIASYLRDGSPLAYAAAFGGGVLASLTPCVYPVIPVTVGYIGSRSAGSRRRAVVISIGYVGGMATVYAALGSAAALTGRLFGTVAASPWTHLLLAALCLLLGLSLFDLFAIPVPRLAGAPGAELRGSGAWGGILMGALSGLVVGPCTAPVLGALLVYVASRQGVFFGMSLLFAFALGMGSLLLLLGIFSGLVASLPRPGPWLVAVKRAFGAGLVLSAVYLAVRAAALF